MLRKANNFRMQASKLYIPLCCVTICDTLLARYHCMGDTGHLLYCDSAFCGK